MAAGTIGAFCEFAVGEPAAFRRELADSLISLGWLRVVLMNQRAPLPDGDDGLRGVHPDTEIFTEFVWPAYVEVPGRVFACRSFMGERRVLEVEARLRARSGGRCVWKRWRPSPGHEYIELRGQALPPLRDAEIARPPYPRRSIQA
jgi:hypothetical protein